MDVDSVIQTVLRELIGKRGFRVPLHIATLAANGASIITRIEAPPAGSEGSAVTQTHVAGEVGEEGFAAPLHMLVTDAVGKVRIIISRGQGTPLILVPRPEIE